jgi:hypothetical protein
VSLSLPLDVFEIERARYHLGYPEVQPAASIQYGIPRPIQTAFLFETAVHLIVPVACDRVRRILRIMDDIETQMSGPGLARLAATQLEDLTVRADEQGQLDDQYVKWGERLADVIGVPIYAYSTKYRRRGGNFAGNIPRR